MPSNRPVQFWFGVLICAGLVLVAIGTNWGVIRAVSWPWRMVFVGAEVTVVGWLLGEMMRTEEGKEEGS